MRQWPERKTRRARIEIIPMIDVMMFLLVFFVLISLDVLPSLGLHVALPKSSAPDHLSETKRITITIAKSGDVMLDSVPVPIASLTGKLRDLASLSKIDVIIAGDGAAQLQNLVDVLDALKAAQISSIAIVAKQK